MAPLTLEQVQQIYADIREVDRKYQHPRTDLEVFMQHLLHTTRWSARNMSA